MAVSAAISAAMGLAEVVPEVAGWLGGDDAEATAGKVVDTAKSITGADDAEAARQALKKNPEQLARVREALLQYRAETLAQETERLKAVNKTIRREAQSDDPWVRRWRPVWGYVSSATWAALMGGIVYVMAAHPQYTAEIIDAVTGLTPMWGIALAVLGVNVAKRSQDKQVAAGKDPGPGPLGGLLQRLGGGSG